LRWLCADAGDRLEREAPMLQPASRTGAVTGRVVDIDVMEERVADRHRQRCVPGSTRRPANAGCGSTFRRQRRAQSGERVNLKAMLYPVAGRKSCPAAADFQRELYFAGIGGVATPLAQRIETEPEAVGAEGGWREDLRSCVPKSRGGSAPCSPGSNGGVARR